MINWGIIGCGDVCEVKSGPAFQKVEGSSLFAVMRRDAKKAADFAKRHNVSEHYNQADEIINHPKINAVYIATPPAFHETYAMASIEAGKNVYIEKPVSLNAESCQKIERFANERQIKVVVAHYRRSLPYFLKIKELIASNLIGKIRAVEIKMVQPKANKLVAATESNWRVLPHISGGGLFHDLAPHQLDIVYWLLGKPNNFSGCSANHSKVKDVADTVSLSATFPGEVAFHGLWLFNAFTQEHQDSCIVYGEKGIIRFSFFRNNKLYIETENGKKTLTISHPKHIQQPMIEQVVNYFSGKIENPCSLNEAYYSMLMMDATLRNC